MRLRSWHPLREEDEISLSLSLHELAPRKNHMRTWQEGRIYINQKEDPHQEPNLHLDLGFRSVQNCEQ